MPVTESAPTVSILIAARNEASTIANCLRAISQLNKPANTFEVLIGNDQSTDLTADIVASFIADRANYQLIPIQEAVAGLRGKANVLAQLAQQARGQYLFFTDADTQVPPTWLTAMLQPGSPHVGIVTGVTLPEGPRLFHNLQTVDWLYNLTLTALLGHVGIPVTAMGNNMAVNRVAYDAVGGYESLPFSITEDYTLFRAIVSNGFAWQTLLDERVLARTKPVDTLRAFLHQRKRWMRGASELPCWLVTLLYAQHLAGPLLLLLGWFMPALAVGMYITRLMVQATVLSFGMSRLRQTRLWPYALLFELYQLLTGPLSVLFYWWPTRVEWKGRRFD
ncbi:glycosyltransferase [Spirosoma montaniterrae]|uniref:Glycosyl transferase family 2 n=1 Tax=Spirosoma montaniterrae TaxID=1178516 RepID=A0A1P9WUL9_9BACT|nr:glycosyltransferase [Spirosoma montaniterrae]AQG79077.1 glycosyl transferase family 2 [Spirosoma montaniterrae]